MAGQAHNVEAGAFYALAADALPHHGHGLSFAARLFGGSLAWFVF